MNGEDLQKAMGQISDDIIEEAQTVPPAHIKGKKLKYVGYIAEAAAVLAVVGAAVGGSLFYRKVHSPHTSLTSVAESESSYDKQPDTTEKAFGTNMDESGEGSKTTGTEQVSEIMELNIEVLTEPSETESAQELGEASGTLPIQSDEYLVIPLKGDTGKTSLAFVDSSKRLKSLLEGAQLPDTNGLEVVWTTFDGGLLKLSQTDESGELLYGIYNAEGNSWSVEPSFKYLTMLTGELFADVEEGKKELGTLRYTRTGEPVSDVSGGKCERVGAVISDGVNLYDENGNFLFAYTSEDDKTHTGENATKLVASWGDVSVTVNNKKSRGAVLLFEYDDEGNGRYVLRSFSGETAACGMSGYEYAGSCSEYLNWTDSEGKGLITDMSFNTLIDEDEFKTSNAYLGKKKLKGTKLRLVSEGKSNIGDNWNRQKYIVSLTDDKGNAQYLYCTASWEVLGSDSSSTLCIEYEEGEDGTSTAWLLELNDNERNSATDLWDQTIEFSWQGLDLGGAEISDSVPVRIISKSDRLLPAVYASEKISDSDNLIGVIYATEEKSKVQYHAAIVSSEGFEQVFSGYYSQPDVEIDAIDDDTVRVSITGSTEGEAHALYFDANGAYLGGDDPEILYMNADMKAIKGDDSVRIVDNSGNELYSLNSSLAKSSSGQSETLEEESTSTN